MKLETEYNIGDCVWCLDVFNKPQKGEILSISTFYNYKCKECNYINYYVHPYGIRQECDVFLTEEELLKSLQYSKDVRKQLAQKF